MRWLDSITDYKSEQSLGDSEGQGSLSMGSQRVGLEFSSVQSFSRVHLFARP